MLKSFALIGKDIQHSRSPQVYRELLKEEIDYRLLDYSEPGEIPPLGRLLLKHKRVSVTAPYKNFVFDKCDEVEGLAKNLEAVNAIKLEKEKVVGTNTDALAFQDIFTETFKNRVSEAVILGDGSMSRLAQTVFRKEGVPFNVLSRKLGNLSLLDQALKGSQVPLVVNTCLRSYTIEFSFPKPLEIWDMNYLMPANKIFSDQNGHNYTDGEELLTRQARYALSFWNL